MEFFIPFNGMPIEKPSVPEVKRGEEAIVGMILKGTLKQDAAMADAIRDIYIYPLSHFIPIMTPQNFLKKGQHHRRGSYCHLHRY